MDIRREKIDSSHPSDHGPSTQTPENVFFILLIFDPVQAPFWPQDGAAVAKFFAILKGEKNTKKKEVKIGKRLRLSAQKITGGPGGHLRKKTGVRTPLSRRGCPDLRLEVSMTNTCRIQLWGGGSVETPRVHPPAP